MTVAKGAFGKKVIQIIKPTKKKVAVLVVIALAAGVFVVYKKVQENKQAAMSDDAVQTDVVTRGDVEVTITGSAAVEPNERYEIISMVSGDIISSPYEVGDYVEKDAVLYQFDTSDTDLNMQKQEIALQQSEMSYQDALEELDKLQVTAKSSGVLSDLNCKVGDEINANETIANIANSKMLEVTLPFNQSQIDNIYVGQTATISSSVHMSSVTGTVTEKEANPKAQADGSSLYDVTISFENPGAFTAGLVVGGEINGMISPGSGTVQYSDEGTVTAETSGTVESLRYKNGDYVEEGAVIATLSSSTIDNQIENSRLSYENSELTMQQSRESLEDYSIKSPISGTVLTKTAKAGDTIDKTNSTEILMVVADISKLKFDLEIDELDVSKVSVGQQVSITSDALEGEEFIGEITNVSVEGTATNGVTTYNAEVIINEPGNLRPSMNVDASVIVESATDTLLVPTGDIRTVMGKNYVFVKDASEDDQMPQGQRPGQMQEGGDAGEAPEGMGDAAGGPPAGMPESGGETAPAADENAQTGTQRGGNTPTAPEGFTAVEVQIGVSGDDYTEVLSGVKEGDIIQRISTTTSDSSSMMMGGMGGMSGGMGGMGGGASMGGSGGPPSGGGGAPSGGGPRG